MSWVAALVVGLLIVGYGIVIVAAIRELMSFRRRHGSGG